MNKPTNFIVESIKRGQTKYNAPKPTWNQYVKQNYNMTKVPGQHPMTTLSKQYKNLQK